jgi:hypothetical protein
MTLSTPPTKGRQKAVKVPSAPSWDMFTVLCKTELRADCVKEFRFHPTRKWRFDYAIPLHKIAIEVEGGVWSGGRHTSPRGFLNDIEKYNCAALMGWRLFRCTPDTLLTNNTILLLKQAICGDFDAENDIFCAKM